MQDIDTEFAEKNETPNPAPGIYKVLGAVGLDIVLLIFFSFASISAGFAIWTLNEMFNNGFHATKAAPGPNAILLISMLSLYSAILVLSLWRGRKLVLPQLENNVVRQIVFSVLTGFALLAFTIASTHAMSVSGHAMKPSNQVLLENSGKQWPLVVGFFAVVAAPVFEEIFFRKQIFARLAGAGYLATGYLLSSLLFALMHEPAPTQGWGRWILALAMYGSMGAVFAWVYKKTGRLWPAILTHMTNNSVAMFALLLGSSAG